MKSDYKKKSSALRRKVFKYFLEYCEDYFLLWKEHERICWWLCYVLGKLLLWGRYQHLRIGKLYACPGWYDILSAIPEKGAYWKSKYITSDQDVKRSFFNASIPDLASRLVSNAHDRTTPEGEDQNRPLTRMKRSQRKGEWASNFWRFSPEFLEWLVAKKKLKAEEIERLVGGTDVLAQEGNQQGLNTQAK